MPFALIAEFPLGFYRAHTGEGELDLVPSPARVHSALLAAAGSGVRATLDPDTGLLMPSTEDEAALKWLEANAPDGIIVPEHRRPSRDHLRFRATGTLPKEGGQWQLDKKVGDDPEATVAIAGEYGWTWSEDPPDDIRHALDALASETSHLGTAESPVRLRTDDRHPTHTWAPDATPWSRPGIDVDAPEPGRTQALIDGHTQYMTRRITPERKHSGSDDVSPPPRVTASIARRRYLTVEKQSRAPWDRVVLIPIDVERDAGIDVDWRVATAVRFHRALISEIGDGAPPLVTGHYAEEVVRPANRLAIQFVTASMGSAHVTRGTSLAVLIPHDAPDDELAVTLDAVDGMRQFSGVGGRQIRFRRDDGATMADAATFWDMPESEGLVQTAVPAVSDIRPSRAAGWSIPTAIALSVGLVWRDDLDEPGRGMRWMARLAHRAEERGVTTHRIQAIRSNQARFVHRVHPRAVVAPYNATLSLGDLATGRELIAIGQARHLGGGLLIPHRPSGDDA